MRCNCGWFEGVIAVVVIVFSLLWDLAASRWVVFAMGVLLLLHSLSANKHKSYNVALKKSRKRK